MSNKNQPNEQPESAKPELNLDPCHKLNQPVEIDPALFGGLSDIKIPEAFSAPAASVTPEPKSKSKSQSKSKKAPMPVEQPDEESVLFASVPSVEKQVELAMAARSEQVRNVVTSALKQFWPAAYERYRSLKYPVPGTEPTLAQRKVAYEFAFRAFLALTYRQSYAEGQQG